MTTFKGRGFTGLGVNLRDVGEFVNCTKQKKKLMSAIIIDPKYNKCQKKHLSAMRINE